MGRLHFAAQNSADPAAVNKSIACGEKVSVPGG
jgi:hypothetical protein